MHTGYVDNTLQTEILTKTSSRELVTSTLIRTADRVNCTQCWYASSKLPPRRRTSLREEVLDMIRRLMSAAPVLLTMTSSEKACPLSVTTKGALFILSRRRSTPAGLMAFSSLSNTSQPGVSSVKGWSRGKHLLLWKCRKISW